MNTGSLYPRKVRGGRDGARNRLVRAVQLITASTKVTRESVDMAAHPSWRHLWSGDAGAYWSRRSLAAAYHQLQELQELVREALRAVEELHELYPAAHADDWSPERGGTPGACRCGRAGASCPARAALERGEALWADERGLMHPVTGGSTTADL